MRRVNLQGVKHLDWNCKRNRIITPVVGDHHSRHTFNHEAALTLLPSGEECSLRRGGRLFPTEIGRNADMLESG